MVNIFAKIMREAFALQKLKSFSHFFSKKKKKKY